MMNNKSAENNFGFSVLEIVIALSLFALLATLLFTLTNQAWKKYHAQQTKQQSASEAVSLMQRMMHDMHAVVFVPNSFFINLPTFDRRSRKNIFFLISTSSLQESGDLCAVGYFFVTENCLPNHARCYRFQANASETFDALQKNTLEEFFEQVAFDDPRCTCIASNLESWKIEPAQFIDGKIVFISLEKEERYSTFPALLELEITAGNFSASAISKPLIFSTVIALRPGMSHEAVPINKNVHAN